MEIKDWLKSINETKEDLTSKISSYKPFIINRCLAGNLDTIFFANEMNLNFFLDSDIQYHFYLNSLRKRKRYSSWIRKENIETLELIKRYYSYNDEKAIQALNILSSEQINFIKQRMLKGEQNERNS